MQHTAGNNQKPTKKSSRILFEKASTVEGYKWEIAIIILEEFFKINYEYGQK